MEQIQKNRKKANYTLIRVCSFVTALGLTVAAPFFIKGKTSKGKIYYPTKITTTKVDFNDYYSLINTNETEMYDKEQKENHITLKVIEHGKENTDDNNEDNTTNYHLHTMQTVYDISYYTNLIDIHIDNPLVITMNPFQVNSLLQLLNSILDQQQPTSLTSKQSIDSLPIESGSVTPPNETPPNETPQDKTTTQPTKPVYPVTSRFNVNAISLWLESFTFNYYMPLTLLPSSYQQHLSYTGEEKEKQSSSFPSLSSFALPYDFLILLLF